MKRGKKSKLIRDYLAAHSTEGPAAVQVVTF
jgi:hypothetical protein